MTTKNITVQKFGGSSVATPERIFNVARRIIAARHQNNHVVVVLSAQGNTTDILLQKAREINPNSSNLCTERSSLSVLPAVAANGQLQNSFSTEVARLQYKRELDMLLCTGEQQSVALMAMALQSLGYGAVSLTAVQVGIHATTNHGNAHIQKIDTGRIISELKQDNIVLVAGFQGINEHSDLTTLGRGASDTTAVALAAVLNADICEINSDVDGIYTADPRIVPTARKLHQIGYDSMLELAFAGVQMLHGRAVEMAKRYNVKIVVRSSMSDGGGTTIYKEDTVEELTISGIAIDRDVAKISIVGLPNEPGIAYKIFDILAKEQISVDIIQHYTTQSGTEISFTVQAEDMATARNLLAAKQSIIGYKNIEADENLAKLSVVGAGMATNSGVAATMFEALHKADINIHLISTSEIKIAVLVDEKLVVNAATAVHDIFDTISRE